MKRISRVSVEKTLRCLLQMKNKKCFSLSSSLSSKDGQGDGSGGATSTPVSAPSAEKGGYSAASSQNYSKSSSGHMKVNNLLTPTVKQMIEHQPAGSVTVGGAGTSAIHYQRTGESKLGSPTTTQPFPDARRDVSSATSSSAPGGGSAEKTNVHLLKTNLDHASSSSQEDAPIQASRRVDPSTVRQVYYFDTLAFAKKLETKGFTREQAEGCAECLVEIINTTLDHQSRHMVTKPQQEIAVLQLMSEIVSVKKDMTLLQKSEFSSLKTETEKISIQLSQVQGHMNDEIVKLKGQFSLDINLERGRAIEAHAGNEKRLQQLHNKIETEVANLKTIYEVYRNDVFKYAGGTVIAVGGLMLGVIRIWN